METETIQMPTQTKPAESIKIGTVSSSEIDTIMNGGELLRVSDEDIENIFDLSSSQNSVAFSLAPILNDNDSASAASVAFVGAIICGITAYFTTFNMAGLYAAIATVCSLAILGGLCLFTMGVAEAKEPTDKLLSTVIGTALMAGCSAIMYAIRAESWENPLMILFPLLCIAEFCIIGFLAVCNFEFAKKSITLNKDAINLSKNGYRNDRFYESSLPTDYEKLCNSIELKLSQYNIPKSIIYTMANQFLMDFKWSATIQYIKPVYDKHVNRKEQERLAKDPAIIMSKNDQQYLVGAWDVDMDIIELNKHIKQETKADLKEAIDTRSKLTKKQFNSLVSAMRKKTNAQIA